jgi:hypothetical protein
MLIEKHTKTKSLDKTQNNYIYTEVDFDIENKQIHNFCVIQFHKQKNKNIEIIRIDNSHEKPHIHKYYIPNHPIETITTNSLQETFNYAKSDIQKNWKKYLKYYKKKDLK